MQDIQLEDEAIMSLSNVAQPRAGASEQNSMPRRPQERELQKTTWVMGDAKGACLDTLDDFGGSASQPFDQFAGKKTNYSDNIYSTQLDMSQVSEETRQRAKAVEQDVLGAASSNRHMAEERNQVAQKGIEIEEGEEESKYGATDHRNQVAVRNQDGGVFNRNSKNGANNNNNNNTKQTANNKRKRNNKVTAPPGKFKNFHAEIKKEGPGSLKDMNE